MITAIIASPNTQLQVSTVKEQWALSTRPLVGGKNSDKASKEAVLLSQVKCLMTLRWSMYHHTSSSLNMGGSDIYSI